MSVDNHPWSNTYPLVVFCKKGVNNDQINQGKSIFTFQFSTQFRDLHDFCYNIFSRVKFWFRCFQLVVQKDADNNQLHVGVRHTWRRHLWEDWEAQRILDRYLGRLQWQGIPEVSPVPCIPFPRVTLGLLPVLRFLPRQLTLIYRLVNVSSVGESGISYQLAILRSKT